MRILGVFICFLILLTGCSNKTTKAISETNAISDDSYWLDVTSGFKISNDCQDRVMPLKYLILQVNYSKLRALLLKPQNNSGKLQLDTVNLPVILPNGLTEHFLITPIQVMPPALADKYPEIRTYSGNGVESPADIIRLDIAPKGVSAMILSSRGTMVIDPFCKSDTSHVISYFKNMLPPDAKPEFEK